MKLENVFYGFTKEGKRKLLWKKYKVEFTDYGYLERTIYYDLENKKDIEPYEVDEKTLVPIVKLIGDCKRKRKRKVIKAYKADCDLLYDATGVFYGNVVNKTTYYDLKTLDGYYIGTGRNNLYDVVLIPKLENVLFARIDDSEGRVQDVKNGDLYPWSDKVRKGVSVKEIRPIKKELFDEVVVTKKKLLEADYKKEL